MILLAVNTHRKQVQVLCERYYHIIKQCFIYAYITCSVT